MFLPNKSCLVTYLLFDHMYIRLCIYIYYFSRNSTDLYYKDYHLLFCWKQFGWYKFFLYKNSHFVHLLFGRWCHLRIYKYFYSHFWTLVYSVKCFYHVGVIYKVFILSKNDDLNNGNFRILMFFSECIAWVLSELQFSVLINS